MRTMADLTGRVVVVTGGNGGIGLGIQDVWIQGIERGTQVVQRDAAGHASGTEETCRVFSDSSSSGTRQNIVNHEH
jgi:NAD(P)-dependent dehydrogenase (short-subunit alcohol dehydrogenase family)